MADDLSRIAWISGSNLHWNLACYKYRFASQARRALAAILSDGSIAVIFGRWFGGAMGWRDRPVRSASRRLDVSEADQAITDDDYLAISSASTRGSCCIISVWKMDGLWWNNRLRPIRLSSWRSRHQVRWRR